MFVLPTIRIALYVDVKVEQKDGHSWEALNEGFSTIKETLQKNDKIKNVYHEGISYVQNES